MDMSYDSSRTSYSYSSDGTSSKAYTNQYGDYTRVQKSNGNVYSETYYDNKYGGSKTETYNYAYGTTTYSESGYNGK